MERILCDNLYVSKDDFFAYIQIFSWRYSFMEILQAKNLRKIYGSGNNAVHALDGVDLRQHRTNDLLSAKRYPDHES